VQRVTEENDVPSGCKAVKGAGAGWGADLVVGVDATFATSEVYQYLEKRDFLYAIRLLSNDVLEQ